MKPPILELGPEFYDEVTPALFPKKIPRFLNKEKAQFLGLSDLDWTHHFAEFFPLKDNLQKPLALRYHGHQFRSYNPDLGDGRGFLYAQFLVDGKIYDLGTKGSGQTPYSRSGDGRLTLKGAMREALATETLESYGVNTSQTFCFFETGENLQRNDEPSPTRSAVLTRLSHGHIRFGTFQRLAYLHQTEAIQKLLAYVVKHYYPEADQNTELETASALLSSVSKASADLCAQWMIAGFVHGVLNTDNMNITGESFDYGPYRFLPTYDPSFTAAYFDHSGLYSFGRQPHSVFWNLQQLCNALSVAFPEIDRETLTETFENTFRQKLLDYFLAKLNLKSLRIEDDEELLSLFFNFLENKKLGYEQTFFDLSNGALQKRLQKSPQASHYEGEAFLKLKSKIEIFEIRKPVWLTHPYFKGEKPETLLYDEIESLWKPISENDDWSLFENKISRLRSMRGLYTYVDTLGSRKK